MLWFDFAIVRIQFFQTEHELMCLIHWKDHLHTHTHTSGITYPYKYHVNINYKNIVRTWRFHGPKFHPVTLHQSIKFSNIPKLLRVTLTIGDSQVWFQSHVIITWRHKVWSIQVNRMSLYAVEAVSQHDAPVYKAGSSTKTWNGKWTPLYTSGINWNRSLLDYPTSVKPSQMELFKTAKVQQLQQANMGGVRCVRAGSSRTQGLSSTLPEPHYNHKELKQINHVEYNTLCASIPLFAPVRAGHPWAESSRSCGVQSLLSWGRVEA